MPTLHEPPFGPDATEEHELPRIEAQIALTLALMTGFSQSLQASIDPARRLRMGIKIDTHLAMLTDEPGLSPSFRQMLASLRVHWQAMSECTAQAASDCAAPIEIAAPAHEAAPRPPADASKRLH